MKAIKVNDSVCYNCGQFTQYYEKSFHNFYSCGYGFCKEKNFIVKEENKCNCFIMRKKGLVTAEEVDTAIRVVSELKELL